MRAPPENQELRDEREPEGAKGVTRGDHVRRADELAGFTKRMYTWLRQPRPLGLEVLACVAALVAAVVMWFVVLPVWYIIFVVILGSVTVPYRLVRRSQREQRHLFGAATRRDSGASFRAERPSDRAGRPFDR